MSDNYVLLTTISQFRHRYLIPQDKFNGDTIVEDISNGLFEEFSQKDLDEVVVEGHTVTEDQALDLFDIENEYLKAWTKEQKIDFIKRNS